MLKSFFLIQAAIATATFRHLQSADAHAMLPATAGSQPKQDIGGRRVLRRPVTSAYRTKLQTTSWARMYHLFLTGVIPVRSIMTYIARTYDGFEKRKLVDFQISSTNAKEIEDAAKAFLTTQLYTKSLKLAFEGFAGILPLPACVFGAIYGSWPIKIVSATMSVYSLTIATSASLQAYLISREYKDAMARQIKKRTTNNEELQEQESIIKKWAAEQEKWGHLFSTYHNEIHLIFEDLDPFVFTAYYIVAIITPLYL